jgi:RNA recognition motif-containing protein
MNKNQPKDFDYFTVSISNIPQNVDESFIFNLFTPFGSIKRIMIGKYKNTGSLRGYAFVTFYATESAQKAIYNFSDPCFKMLSVKLAIRKHLPTSSPSCDGESGCKND